MTAVVPERTARLVPGPCITVAPSSGPVITGLFVLTVALFLLGLIAL
ncbi:MAG TPA: hypothetical protein VNA11_04365 [Pseudonocardia sp.]|jgi:hypothetical protein|nr:hypothetical protein [Pseudonocardia sp.]